MIVNGNMFASVDIYEDELFETVRMNFNPEDVFKEEDLIEWAEENGFVKEEDLD